MINPVIQQSQARWLTFALLKELAFRHHPRYHYAFPRLQTLATALRVSVRTVQRHIHKLEELGELRVVRTHGRGRNNRYFLTALENMTGQRHSNQTREKTGINARHVPYPVHRTPQRRFLSHVNQRLKTCSVGGSLGDHGYGGLYSGKRDLEAV